MSGLLYDTSTLYDSDTTYYGDTAADRPVIKVEMDLSSAYPTEVLDIDYGGVLAYDSGSTYDNPDRYDGFVLFDDITSDVLSIEITRGKDAGSQVYEHFDAGTCSLELGDRTSKYLPDEVLSPYYPNITPLRQVRISATWSGATNILFRGFVDRWDVQWQPKQQYAEVRVTATDATKLLANFDTTYQGLDDDPSWDRVSAMLLDKSWPADFSDVEQGTWTAVSTRTNLIDNPSAEVAAFNATSQYYSPVVSTDYAYAGTYSSKHRMVGFPATNPLLANNELCLATLTGLTNPSTVVMSMYCLVPLGSPLVGKTVSMGSSMLGGTGTLVSVSPATLIANQWVRVSAVWNFTSATVVPYFTINGLDASTLGAFIYLDGMSAEVGSDLGNYFDGSTYLGPADYVGAVTAWTGTANNSDSTATEYEGVYFAKLVQDVADRRPLLENLQEYEFTEQGALYVSKEGRITWRNIDTANPEMGDDPIYIFSDTGLAGYVPISEVVFGISDDNVYNTVSITPSLGTEQVATDTASVDVYRERGLIQTDVPIMTDAAGNDLARFLLHKQGAPVGRIESVSTDPRISTHAAGVALTQDLLAPIDIQRTPPGGSTNTYAMYVSGIKHSITPDSWTTTFVTSYRFDHYLLAGPQDIVIP